MRQFRPESLNFPVHRVTNRISTEWEQVGDPMGKWQTLVSTSEKEIESSPAGTVFKS